MRSAEYGLSKNKKTKERPMRSAEYGISKNKEERPMRSVEYGISKRERERETYAQRRIRAFQRQRRRRSRVPSTLLIDT